VREVSFAGLRVDSSVVSLCDRRQTRIVADNTGLSSFLLLPPKSAKSHAILRKFDLIAVQGHRRSSILMPIKSACKFQLWMHLVRSYRFRDIDACCSKIACFHTPLLFDAA